MNQSSSKTRILLADDNADAGDTLGAFLQMLGFEVRVVRDGTSAASAAASELPNVAILDLGMPGLDGWEVCRRIRALPGGESIRIVALSGWGSEDARRKSEEAGFDAHWTKPAEPFSLVALLRQ